VLTEEEAAALAGKTGKAFLFGAPGQIAGLARGQGPVAAAGEGYLLLTRVQPAGKKPMDGWSWLNGSRLAPGQAFS
jgi:methionyl-tRNA formyltransferase